MKRILLAPIETVAITADNFRISFKVPNQTAPVNFEYLTSRGSACNPEGWASGKGRWGLVEGLQIPIVFFNDDPETWCFGRISDINPVREVSGTPLLLLISGILGLFLWRIR
jgi:hypothetical protein